MDFPAVHTLSLTCQALPSAPVVSDTWDSLLLIHLDWRALPSNPADPRPGDSQNQLLASASLAALLAFQRKTAHSAMNFKNYRWVLIMCHCYGFNHSVVLTVQSRRTPRTQPGIRAVRGTDWCAVHLGRMETHSSLPSQKTLADYLTLPATLYGLRKMV